jgi:hypothetical protein
MQGIAKMGADGSISTICASVSFCAKFEVTCPTQIVGRHSKKGQL